MYEYFFLFHCSNIIKEDIDCFRKVYLLYLNIVIWHKWLWWSFFIGNFIKSFSLINSRDFRWKVNTVCRIFFCTFLCYDYELTDFGAVIEIRISSKGKYASLLMRLNLTKRKSFFSEVLILFLFLTFFWLLEVFFLIFLKKHYIFLKVFAQMYLLTHLTTSHMYIFFIFLHYYIFLVTENYLKVLSSVLIVFLLLKLKQSY